MVKASICSFDLKSGILCPKCEEKLRKGLITELDVKVIKILSELEKKFPILEDVSFHKAFEVDDVLAILVNRQDIGKILGQGGRIKRDIEEAVNKKVKLLNQGGDSRQFLEELFSPLSILAINTVWLPDGSTETKAVLHGRKPRHMPIDLNAASKLAKYVKGMTLSAEFERY